MLIYQYKYHYFLFNFPTSCGETIFSKSTKGIHSIENKSFVILFISVSKLYILLGGAVAIIAVFKAVDLTYRRMEKWASFVLTSIIHETVTLVRGLCLFTIYQYYSRRNDESHLLHI